MSSILAWVALFVLGLILVLQIVYETRVRRVFAILEREAGNSALLSEARSVSKRGGRAKFKWLRAKRTELTGDALRVADMALQVDRACILLGGVLVILGVVAAAIY